MSDSGRRTPPQSLIGTSFSPAGGSRPFLNLLNPIGRQYSGYTPAGLLQEADDQDDADEDDGTPRGSAYKSRVEHVPLDDLQRGATRRGNTAAESSDEDEVPQSFLIEANSAPIAQPTRQEKVQTAKSTPRRSTTSKQTAPILPTHHESLDRQQQAPHPARPTDASRPFSSGLDNKERALWNWVNVYNLDAYLQDVFFQCLLMTRPNLGTLGLCLL
jgi:autophagy-related protein 9